MASHGLIDSRNEIVYLGKMSTGIVRLIFVAAIVYLVMAVVRFFRNIGRNRPSTAPPKKITGVMVKDEICNTYLPREIALREVSGGKEHFFCSGECRARFLDEKRPRA